MELKDRLQELRNEKGLTMDMLVYDMNNKFQISLNKGLLSRWENGVNEPSLRYAAYLAQYYDVSLDYLIGLTDVRIPSRLLTYSKKMREIPTLDPELCGDNATVLSASEIPQVNPAFAARTTRKVSQKILDARNKNA